MCLTLDHIWCWMCVKWSHCKFLISIYWRMSIGLFTTWSNFPIHCLNYFDFRWFLCLLYPFEVFSLPYYFRFIVFVHAIEFWMSNSFAFLIIYTIKLSWPKMLDKNLDILSHSCGTNKKVLKEVAPTPYCECWSGLPSGTFDHCSIIVINIFLYGKEAT